MLLFFYPKIKFVTLVNYLAQFISDERNKLFDRVLEKRTRYITVALEDIYQPQNASAVIRTCECLGIQDLHIIEQKNPYQVNPDVVIGSSQWINIINYNKAENNTSDAIAELRSKGYRIIATSPGTKCTDLEDFDIAKGKIALFFGTELTGLTYTLLENADENIKIPMFGFTQSFNISVSAAIVLQNLTYRLRNSFLDWKLTSDEKDMIKLDWLKTTIPKSDLIVERYNHETKN